MASLPDRVTPEQAELIRAAKVFFVARAGPSLEPGPEGQGSVNLSPKGGTPLHVIDERCVAYLDYTGSGNETARHAEAGGPVTLMVMAMDAENAAIVCVYGPARAVPLAESRLAERLNGCAPSRRRSSGCPSGRRSRCPSSGRRRPAATGCRSTRTWASARAVSEGAASRSGRLEGQARPRRPSARGACRKPDLA